MQQLDNSDFEIASILQSQIDGKQPASAKSKLNLKIVGSGDRTHFSKKSRSFASPFSSSQNQSQKMIRTNLHLNNGLSKGSMQINGTYNAIGNGISNIVGVDQNDRNWPQIKKQYTAQPYLEMNKINNTDKVRTFQLQGQDQDLKTDTNKYYGNQQKVMTVHDNQLVQQIQIKQPANKESVKQQANNRLENNVEDRFVSANRFISRFGNKKGYLNRKDVEGIVQDTLRMTMQSMEMSDDDVDEFFRVMTDDDRCTVQDVVDRFGYIMN